MPEVPAGSAWRGGAQHPALEILDVARIDAGGHDPDFDFARGRRAIGHLFDGKILQIVGKSREANGFHDMVQDEIVKSARRSPLVGW